MENLNKKGSFYKFNAIVACTQLKAVSDEVVEKLIILKDDYSQIAGHTISDFSIAALDIIGVEKYTGSDISIKELINSKFSFYNA